MDALAGSRAGPSASADAAGTLDAAGPGHRKRRNHRGGKKKRAKRKSFAAGQEDEQQQSSAQDPALTAARDDYYQTRHRNLSGTSIDTQALMDHREQSQFLRPRRPSIAVAPSATFPANFQFTQSPSRLRNMQARVSEDEDDENWQENAPLLSASQHHRDPEAWGFGGYGTGRPASRSSSKRKFLNPFSSSNDNFHINYPPSVPASPNLKPTSERLDMSMSFGDVMLRDELSGQASPHRGQDDLPDTILQPSPLNRRHTIALEAEGDVCFPQDGMSELADDELHVRSGETPHRARARRRRGKWPDLSILEEWSRFEKEGRSDEGRAKKITEPQLINGRLRPINKGWFRAEEDAPYRFTYFNEELQSTIHSQTISEVVQPGGSFRELFRPEPPVLSDSESESEEDEPEAGLHRGSISVSQNGESKFPSQVPSREPSLVPANNEARRDRTLSPTQDKESGNHIRDDSGTVTPSVGPTSPLGIKSPTEVREEKPLRYGERPVWWLDVLSPTEAEMRVISKTFGIHPLTAEDIMMQETREKVELFRNYYFVSYRSFDQDQNSTSFMDPVEIYAVVFREGVISFHFSMTPHPANVRRRVRQLNDYMLLSSDWISYAVIDDVTDAFVPLISEIEKEVDDIDDAILELHSSADPASKDHNKKPPAQQNVASRERKGSSPTEPPTEPPASHGDMLRRVGDCRKKVMGLYRLLSNKADVIKGFAKRCNEHWEVAPRSEIGLYLGDIQDHIVTMTASLGHCEKILARAHGNYLAQINIRMNERQEQTADVLGKLTVLGTIVLPMNIITGLWGMNVWVPGQEFEGDLNWFIAITAGLLFFGLACYWTAKRVYGIV